VKQLENSDVSCVVEFVAVAVTAWPAGSAGTELEKVAWVRNDVDAEATEGSNPPATMAMSASTPLVSKASGPLSAALRRLSRALA
jgi:hypothetical protein